MRIAYLGPAGTFTEDALGEAAPSGGVRAAAHGDDPRRDPRRRARRGRARAGADRELDRGLGPPHARHPRLRGRLGDDRRRARLRGARPPDRPRGRSSWARSRRSSPTSSRWPSAPASCASSCPGSNCAASAAPRRRCGWSPSRSGPGRRSAPAPRPRSTAARSSARGSRTRPTTSPASSGSRPPAPPPAAGEAWKTSLVFSELGEDHPGALVNALSEFSSRGINLSRIESRPLRSGLGRYMFFCDARGSRDATRSSPRRSRPSAPRPTRSGSSAPTRSPEQAQKRRLGVAAWRPAYNSRQSWLESSYSTRRMSRSTSAR